MYATPFGDMIHTPPREFASAKVQKYFDLDKF